jgi:hypothetical protein
MNKTMKGKIENEKETATQTNWELRMNKENEKTNEED